MREGDSGLDPWKPPKKCENRIPVATFRDLEMLSDAEVLEGYQDGLDNFPCGENRSRSYWHGWRNGMVDGGYVEADYSQAKLASEYVAAMSKNHQNTTTPEGKTP